MKLSTKLIHAGIEPDPATGAIMTPIYQTSTYVQSAPGVHKGYEYARSQNPTRKVLESALAHIENGKHGLCFSSGVAATDAVLRLLPPGDEVIAANDMYGGTYRLFTKIFEKTGIRFHFVNMQHAEAIRPYINANTKLVWAETPTNPLMNIIDIAALAAITRQHRILLCVDNTFASPYLQNPLDLGADITLHSATKYLGGHSDVIHGCLVMNDDTLREKLYFIQKSCGAVPGPQDCFLVLRGIKTLHVRMRQHCENASTIAHWLETHSKVEQVIYPGLPKHPQHALASRQMTGFGGMVSVYLKADLAGTKRFLERCELFTLAESLGGVESLIGHPVLMSHASLTPERRAELKLTDNLVRLSVGIEDGDDLIADLDRALSAI